MGLVIDTHILIWYLAEPNKLSQKAINAIDENLKQTGGIIIPIICLAEVLHVAEKKRISATFEEIIKIIEFNKSFYIYPLNLDIIKKANNYKGLEMHDRLIYTTCKHLNFPLVSKDSILRKFDLEVIW